MSETVRVLAFACLVGALAACFEPLHDVPAEHFDCERWIAEPGSRGEMADDLIANHLKIGMSKSEVGTLLGFDAATVGRIRDEDIGPVASVPDLPCCHFTLEFDDFDRLIAVSLDAY